MKLIDGSRAELTTFRIPGGRVPVKLVRLHADPAGDRWSLVEFPPGFARPTPGAFAAEEEFVVIDGDVIINGITFLPGDHAYVPAGTPRRATSSDVGLLAVSWFADSPRWSELADEERTGSAVKTHWPHLPPLPGPMGRGRLVRDGAVMSWVLDEAPTGVAERRTALFSLSDLSFAWLEPEDEFPPMSGPVFARA